MSTKAKVGQFDTTEVRLYVAEDFRQETNHKVSAIGLYTDNRVLLQIPPNLPDPTVENPAALRSLCFLFNIFGAPDAATVSVDIEDPIANKVVVPVQKLPVNSSVGAANFIVQMEPCIVTALGKRTFIVKVNQREFKFGYVLGRQEAALQIDIESPLQHKATSKTKPRITPKKKVTG